MISIFTPSRQQGTCWVLVSSLLAVAAVSGCKSSGDDDEVIIITSTGVIAADLQSIADYLDLPEVQELFNRMPRYEGSTPPNVEGEYRSGDQAITFTTIPGFNIGELLDETVACFGTAVAGVIDVSIGDPSFVDVGAGSFVEGSGNLFTIYFAFKSIQLGSNGDTCEIHLVRVFSGVRENDGRISRLDVGQAVIALVGDCDNLLVGDLQISRGSAAVPGGPCLFDIGPVDPSRVLVRIENFLIVDLDVFTSNDGFLTETFTPVDPENAAEIEVPPGFELEFVSLPPEIVAGEPIGETLVKLFEPDPGAAGETVIYRITNNIDGNLFFSPIINNQSSLALLPSVNVGIPDSLDGWFCGPCFIQPGATEALGYYAYDILGELPGSPPILFDWTRDNVNIFLFTDFLDVPFAPVLPIEEFELPAFDLEPDTGVIVLDIFDGDLLP